MERRTVIVIRAEAMGICFGVRDALRAIERVDDPSRVTIHGELVHNEQVLTDLDRRGFLATSEADRGAAIPTSPLVLITAHGISDRERNRLEQAGKTLIDTTCPLVRVVHEAAQLLQSDGHFVVVIGRHGHVEVEGITGDLARFAVVSSADEAESYPADRIGIVCQSTTPPLEAERIRRAIVARNPGKSIRFVDTTCRPTRDRQRALESLLDQVEAVVVVGGSRSHNTRQLARLAEERGLPTLLIRSAADIDPSWFAPYQVVGLTAGTSTLDRTIDEVHKTLLNIRPSSSSGRVLDPSELSPHALSH